MSYTHDLNFALPKSRETVNTALGSRNNSEIFGGKCNSFVTTEPSEETRKDKCSSLKMPKLLSQPSPSSHPFLTKPRLLRKKDSEIKRYKELVLKKSLDCVNAISGEQIAMARERELRGKLRELRIRNDAKIRTEKLRSRERLLNKTQELRAQRNEARMIVKDQEILIIRLRRKITQMKQLEKQREKEIDHMKQELETKNMALKNLLRKLVLATFAKKNTKKL